MTPNRPTTPTRTHDGFRLGDVVDPRELTTLDGTTVRLPTAYGLTHLQFRRFAACPICNVHLRTVARRHRELLDAGVTEVAVFYSTAETMQPYQGHLPFAVVPDPERVLYDEFGVGSSIRANLHPRAWTAPLRPATWSVVTAGLRAGAKPGLHGDSINGLPADFLLAPDGTVLAAHYGAHANDQWSVDEVLDLGARHG
jgi:peroxiredoxin